jgi:uncharacterized protein
MNPSKSTAAKVMEAIDSGDLQAVKKLIGDNPDQLHFKTPFGGQTWLGYAARSGNFDAVKHLVSLGFDVNEGDPDEDVKPLCQACCTDRAEVVEYLLDSGAVMDTGTSIQNPLFAAVVARAPSVVKLLLERGIDAKVRYNSKSMKDLDALAFAQLQGSNECARLIALWSAEGDEATAEAALMEGSRIAEENAGLRR